MDLPRAEASKSLTASVNVNVNVNNSVGICGYLCGTRTFPRDALPPPCRNLESL